MLFGDEPRFYKGLRPTYEGGHIFAHVEENETSSHVGPGAYYTTELENTRTGWSHKNFSARQPFKPESSRVDRSHHFIAGVILPGGVIACPGSPQSRNLNPGPGHYNVDRGMLQKSARPQSAGARPSSAFGHSTRSSSSGSLGGTGSRSRPPTPPRGVLRGGMLYSCTDHSSNSLGPGYYNITDSLLRKSFNTRASGAGPGGSARGSPTKPMRTASASGRTSPTGTYVSISPLAQHKRNQRVEEYNYTASPAKIIPPPRRAPNGQEATRNRGGNNLMSSTPHQFNRESKEQYVYETPK